MSQAPDIMRRYNPNALIGQDSDGSISIIEDHIDPDGRIYRLEYKTTPDGRHAVGYCRYNPWGGNPYSYPDSHYASDGFLCLGNNHDDRNYKNSRYGLDYVIKRSRFWCTGFSVLMETGRFPKV